MYKGIAHCLAQLTAEGAEGHIGNSCGQGSLEDTRERWNDRLLLRTFWEEPQCLEILGQGLELPIHHVQGGTNQTPTKTRLQCVLLVTASCMGTDGL